MTIFCVKPWVVDEGPAVLVKAPAGELVDRVVDARGGELEAVLHVVSQGEKK